MKRRKSSLKKKLKQNKENSTDSKETLKLKRNTFKSIRQKKKKTKIKTVDKKDKRNNIQKVLKQKKKKEMIKLKKLFQEFNENISDSALTKIYKLFLEKNEEIKNLKDEINHLEKKIKINDRKFSNSKINYNEKDKFLFPITKNYKFSSINVKNKFLFLENHKNHLLNEITKLEKNINSTEKTIKNYSTKIKVLETKINNLPEDKKKEIFRKIKEKKKEFSIIKNDDIFKAFLNSSASSLEY